MFASLWRAGSSFEEAPPHPPASGGLSQHGGAGAKKMQAESLEAKVCVCGGGMGGVGKRGALSKRPAHYHPVARGLRGGPGLRDEGDKAIMIF